jgi:mannose-6-phosphate isomerase-like protein (cupin superfamily)
LSEKWIHQGERTDKPWGYEVLWAKTADYVGKILFVKAGEALSLQFHRKKEETIILESGECVLEAGESESQLKKFSMKPGSVFHVPPGRIHRLQAVTDCRFYEVSTPHLDDVVRLEDRYGRS